MMNLFEIMQAAQGGNAYANLSRQFGISQEQAQKAVEAMLPAFSTGLQAQAQHPEGFARLLGMLGQSAPAAQWFDADGDGIPDHLQQQGGQALGTLFGGPQVQQAVAQQAAHFAGLNASMMQQMLPVVASMILGGLFKGAANQGLGGLLQQIMQGLGGAAAQPQARPQTGFPQGFPPAMAPGTQDANPLGGILGSVLASMFGQPGAAAPQAPPPRPGFPNPFDLPGMQNQAGPGGLTGGVPGGGRQPESEAQPADPMATALDMLKGMFQTGQQAQTHQMDAFASILEQFTRRR